VKFLYINLATECHRVGVAGLEPPGGQRGCVCTQSRPLLAALAVVKELFLEAVQLEGVKVMALVISSNPTAASLGMAGDEHFVRCDQTFFPV
jgi:hypothetical protein